MGKKDFKLIMTTKKVDEYIRTIWNYMIMDHKLKKSDCIFVFGSHDLRVAEYATQLFLEGWAPLIIFSGGFGRLTKDLFDKPEAEIFARVALDKGVPKDKIIIESESSNTGENVSFVKERLKTLGINPESFILVSKPYMERRVYATFRKLWQEKKNVIVTSPNVSFEDWPDKLVGKEELMSIVIGDLQRIREYPKKGFQISQMIPIKVWSAYLQLVTLGYTKHLIK